MADAAYFLRAYMAIWHRSPLEIPYRLNATYIVISLQTVLATGGLGPYYGLGVPEMETEARYGSSLTPVPQCALVVEVWTPAVPIAGAATSSLSSILNGGIDW